MPITTDADRFLAAVTQAPPAAPLPPTPPPGETGRRLQPTIPVEEVEEASRVRVRPLASDGERSPRNRVRVTGKAQQEEEEAPSGARGQSRFRGRRPSEEADQGDRVRVVGHSDPFQTDFISSPPRPRPTSPPTPPPSIPPQRLSRVRGRPIVPEDFPGPTAAIRGPIEQEEQEDVHTATGLNRSVVPGGRGGGSKKGISVTATGIRTLRARPGLRIVPTGKRARRPLNQEEDEDKEPEGSPDIPERPRASSVSSRPLNRLQPSEVREDELDDREEVPTGPRRRVRPVAGRERTLVTPRRRLRPAFTAERQRQTQEPSVTEATSTTRVTSSSTEASSSATPHSPIEALHTTKALALDPAILIAQVQAAKAEDEPDRARVKLEKLVTANPVIDNSEESNIIPFADVAVPAVPEDQLVHDDIDDLTVINLQKSKGNQNFKDFVDTDLIDDSLRHREHDHDDHVKEDEKIHIPFVPTVRPAAKTPVSIITTTEESTTTQFVPTSIALSTTEGTTTSARGTSSTKSSSEAAPPPVSINDKLDHLQSNLDPWAHIHHDKTNAEAVTTTEQSTTRLSLFNIRTLPPTTTTTTTTFRPRSLADLFKHRAGEKIEYNDGGGPPPPPPSTTESTTKKVFAATSAAKRLSAANRLKARLNKFKAATSSDEDVTTTTTTVRPPINTNLFATTSRDRIIAFRTTTPQSTSTEELSTEKSAVDLLAKIPRDNVGAAVVPPPGFRARPPTTASTPESVLTSSTSTEATSTSTKATRAKSLFATLQQDDVSSFLPPGYRQTTSTSTESSTDLLKEILSSIEEIDESLLPKDFKPSLSTNRFRPKSTTQRTTTTTTAATTSTENSSESSFSKVCISA